MSSKFERIFLALGLAYGALGMSLGIHMAATQNHGQMVTHAHLLLVGFLLSVIYAIIHRLWLAQPREWVARAQFVAHHLGVVLMVTGLYLLYGGYMPHGRLEPLLATASIIVLVALLLMLIMVIGQSFAARNPERKGMPDRL